MLPRAVRAALRKAAREDAVDRGRGHDFLTASKERIEMATKKLRHKGIVALKSRVPKRSDYNDPNTFHDIKNRRAYQKASKRRVSSPLVGTGLDQAGHKKLTARSKATIVSQHASGVSKALTSANQAHHAAMKSGSDEARRKTGRGLEAAQKDFREAAKVGQRTRETGVERRRMGLSHQLTRAASIKGKGSSGPGTQGSLKSSGPQKEKTPLGPLMRGKKGGSFRMSKSGKKVYTNK